MKNTFYRSIQWVTCHVQRLLPWPQPEVITKENALLDIPDLLLRNHTTQLLLVTTPGFIRRGTLEPLFASLQSKNIHYTVFDQVVPNPTIDCIEEGYHVYCTSNSQAIVAIGGGSVLDCAKIIGARVARPNQSVSQMKGMFQIHHKLPDFYAVPTTAGTGSEVTVAAVVTDSNTHYKYAINDTCLLPRYAILDSTLTLGLSPSMTAETGMDALTHAVEAYTNLYSEKASNESAKVAVKMIFDNLTKVYDDGSNHALRSAMLEASFEAGKAFTKAYVGYVHAIAHALGGLYNVPHGYANAVILPVVLEAFGTSVEQSLSELADLVGITGTSVSEKAKAFILQIRKMNAYMNIPDTIDAIREEDIPLIAKRACKEGNPAYPVPQIWNQDKMESVIRKLK